MKTVKQKAAKATKKAPQLLPCPFCASVNVRHAGLPAAIVCLNCESAGPIAIPDKQGRWKKRAATQWNSRIPSLPSLPSVPPSSAGQVTK